MNLSKKNYFVFIASISLCVGLYYFNQTLRYPLHFKTIQQDFEFDKDIARYELRKKELQNYYLCGIYEKEVAAIGNAAARYFCSLSVQDRSSIIFDIDDTAIYHFQMNDRFDFIWSYCSSLVKARQSDQGPAIKPVLELYKNVVDKGFKIIFLSSRNEGDYEHTCKELSCVGYKTFEKVILMPDKLAFDRTIKTADWKLSIRKELARHYTIVGCVGDRDADFTGGFTGHVVKLPNYLY